MTASHKVAQRLTAEVYGRLRSQALAVVTTLDPQMSRLFVRVAGRIRKELRAVHTTEAEVARVVERAFMEALAPDRQALVERMVHVAAEKGVEADREVYRAVFGEESGRPFGPESASPRGETPSE